jgi:hypothetical protein
MVLRTFLAAMALTLPAWTQAGAQGVAAPDCTVDVTVATTLKLDIVYRCRSTTALTFVPDDQEIAAQVSGFSSGKVEPVNGIVEARYRYDLAEYARSVNSAAAGVKRGDSVLTPIPGWLLEPRGFDRLPVIDIRAQLPDGFSFATGLPKVGDAWRLAGTRVGFAGYSAIGKLTLEEIVVPAPGSLRPGAAKQDGVLRLAILDGFAKGGTSDLIDWVRRTAQAESNYWQGFTASHMLVGLVPMQRPGVGYGRTVSGGGASVIIEVGATIEPRRLFNDWVLVHELIHTAMPFVRGRGTWLMEGAATYVEPIIRARAGWKTEAEVWKEWVDNMPRGVAAFAAGLSNASGQQNYWAGATFMLMTDIGIRRATDGAKGLEDCLAGTLWGGLDGPQTVQVVDYAAACDRAAGVTVMSELVNRYYRNSQPVDLTAFWKELGVAQVDGRIVFDDSAPLAKWRKIIVFGPAGRPVKTVKLPWES